MFAMELTITAVVNMTRQLILLVIAVKNLKNMIEQVLDLKKYLAENKKATIALLIIFLGLSAGLYLIQHPQILKSRAAEVTTINTKNDVKSNGTTIIQTTTPHLQITVDPSDIPTN